MPVHCTRSCSCSLTSEPSLAAVCKQRSFVSTTCSPKVCVASIPRREVPLEVTRIAGLILAQHKNLPTLKVQQRRFRVGQMSSVFNLLQNSCYPIIGTARPLATKNFTTNGRECELERRDYHVNIDTRALVSVHSQNTDDTCCILFRNYFVDMSPEPGRGTATACNYSRPSDYCSTEHQQ